MRTKLDPFFNAYRIPDVDVDTLSRRLASDYFIPGDGGESLSARGKTAQVVPNYYVAEGARTVTPKAHRHLFLEIILVCGGTGIFEYNRTERTLTKGDILFIGHFLKHRMKSAAKGFSYIGIRFMPEAIERSATIDGISPVTEFDIFAPFYPGSAAPTVHVSDDAFTRMRIHFLQVTHAFSAASDGLIVHELRALIHAAVAEYRLIAHAAPKNEGSLSAVFAYIRDHIAEPLSLAALAEISGMSRTSLSVKFNRSTGMSLPNYINELRIEQAKHLLRSSRLSVSAVASRTGFASDSFFIREFKKRAGMTPIAFRTRSAIERS